LGSRKQEDSKSINVKYHAYIVLSHPSFLYISPHQPERLRIPAIPVDIPVTIAIHLILTVLILVRISILSLVFWEICFGDTLIISSILIWRDILIGEMTRGQDGFSCPYEVKEEALEKEEKDLPPRQSR
jgi:hypothetical protein